MSVTTLKTPPSTGGDFEEIPAGVYLARAYKMIDLGTQTETSKNFGTKTARKIMLYWELLQDDDGNEVFMKDGERRFSISKKYTWSMHKKAALRKDVDAWRGEPFTDQEANGFEITKLLGQPCKLQVVHNKSGDRTYANVGSIMTTTKRPEGVNELVSFSVTNPDMEVFETFPEWLKDVINESAEWNDDAKDDPEAAPAPAAKTEVTHGTITDEGKIQQEKPANIKNVQF